MTLRRTLFCAVMLSGLAAAYIASPFVAMWNLREAIKAGDAVTIEDRVSWPTVRESLKSSLVDNPSLQAAISAANGDAPPTFWQRVKGAFGATMVDRFIDTYVTAEGLPKLLDYRRLWEANVGGDTIEAAAHSRVERIRHLWARVKRAEFQTLTRIEIEVQDRKVADRRYVSVMELDGLTWKLTRLRVIAIDATARLAELAGTGRAR